MHMHCVFLVNALRNCYPTDMGVLSSKIFFYFNLKTQKNACDTV